MTCTMIVKKMKGQKTSRCCVEVIVQGLPPFLCAVSDNTQLSLKQHSLYSLQCYTRHVCTTLCTMLCNNGTDFQYNNATLQLALYYACSTITIRECFIDAYCMCVCSTCVCGMCVWYVCVCVCVCVCISVWCVCYIIFKLEGEHCIQFSQVM